MDFIHSTIYIAPLQGNYSDTTKATLYSIRCRMGSQWRTFSM